MGLSAGAALGASALAASGAQAATFQVTTDADAAASAANCTPAACTLRDAVEAANETSGADTITFASGVTGTIRLTAAPGQLTVTQPLTISGPGSETLAVSGDGNGNGLADTGDSRILAVQEPASLTLTGLELTRGFATGGSLLPQGGGALPQGGGAVLVRSGASAALRDVALTANTVTGSASGGAILSQGTLNVERSTLSGNKAGGSGGAIARTNELERIMGNGFQKYTSRPIGPATVTGTVLSGNSADTGGALAAFTGKYSSGNSPAAPVPDAIVITGSSISQNTANTGGGVSISQGAAGIQQIRARATVPTARIADSSVTANTAARTGGGLAFPSVTVDASVAVTRSTVSGNTVTDGEGGGLSTGTAVSGSLAVAQSTLSGNSAKLGGGVAIGSATAPATKADGVVVLSGDTIADNTAGEQGGGLQLGRTSTYDANTGSTTFGSPSQPLTGVVVAGNTAADQPNDLGQAPITDGGDGFVLSRSLIQAPGDVPRTTDPAAPSILGVDPKLGALADNGGPTRTQLPTAMSALLDAGKADAGTTTDQRGATRTVDLADVNNATGSDGTDIGAVERSAPVPPAPPAPAAVAAQPAQPVPPAAAPPKPAPSSSFLLLVAPKSRPNKPNGAKQPIVIRGTAEKGTRKVRVAVGYNTGSKCRFLLANRRFSAKRDCRRTLYVTAKGTLRWTLKLPKLRRGRYTIWSRAIGGGQIERKMSERNFQRFRIR